MATTQAALLPPLPPTKATRSPTADPSGGAGTSMQAPDRKSDAIVRVCPFCGSGDVIGNGDGSIECGHDGIVFTVEVQPRHVGQPLVNPDGTPFEPEFDEDDAYPGIGMASADEQAPGQPEDPALAADGGVLEEGQDPREVASAPSGGVPAEGEDPRASAVPDAGALPAEGEDPRQALR